MSDSPLATDRMVGIKLENGWQIVDRIEVDSDGTGSNFSVGFLAVNDEGQKGFIKALDFGKILGTEENQPLETLEFLVESFNYEKRLLTICGEHRMSRIVRLLGEGSIEIDQPDIKYPRVYYLICEVADGDVRKFINFSKEIDVAWRIQCLHQVSVGIQQLHNAQISHQDIKPSNVLMFEEGREAKLADLGRAIDRTADAPYEDFKIPGDLTYAPPELLYGHIPPDWGARRLACDLYHLGSLGFFLFSGTHAVAALLGE